MFQSLRNTLLQLSNMLRAMSTVKQLLEFLLKQTRPGPPVILYPFPLPLPVRAVLILRSKSPLSLNMRWTCDVIVRRRWSSIRAHGASWFWQEVHICPVDFATEPRLTKTKKQRNRKSVIISHITFRVFLELKKIYMAKSMRTTIQRPNPIHRNRIFTFCILSSSVREYIRVPSFIYKL